jgi:hypothetical protein
VGPRLTKSEYEGVVLATLREYLIEQDPSLRYDGKFTVEGIRLVTSGPAHMLDTLPRRRSTSVPVRVAPPGHGEGRRHTRGRRAPRRGEEGVRGREQAEGWGARSS